MHQVRTWNNLAIWTRDTQQLRHYEEKSTLRAPSTRSALMREAVFQWLIVFNDH